MPNAFAGFSILFRQSFYNFVIFFDNQVEFSITLRELCFENKAGGQE
ncbi:hypothetical protein GY50_0002 [Dehalococcoides mccartyi GY50]|nr:hypothetical protein GY50_0002 [Dehalococcoides mccartyi GY50]